MFVVRKLLEKIIRGRICVHLESQKAIKDNQHGFVLGKSCLTNLIEYFSELAKEIDDGKMVDFVKFPGG